MPTTPPLPGWICLLGSDLENGDWWDERWPSPELHPLLVGADGRHAAFWRWYLPDVERRSDDKIAVALGRVAEIVKIERRWLVLDLDLGTGSRSWFDGASDDLAQIAGCFGDGARRFARRTTKEMLSDEHYVAVLAYASREDAWADLAEYYPRVRQMLDLPRSAVEPIASLAGAVLADDTSALVPLVEALGEADALSAARVRAWYGEYLEATRMYLRTMDLSIESEATLRDYAHRHELPTGW